MRKKFFAMYALVGALVASPVFTSCIENEESPTVSAVRNAKAEQLKAAAALAQAQADMEKAVAQAEIAYKNALTEKTTAEAQKAKAEAEEAILQSQYDILQLKQNIANWEDKVYNGLVTNYTTALNNIAEYNRQIVIKTGDVAELERGLVTVQDYVKNQTKTLNKNIATAEATIENLKKLEAYDDTELNAHWNELREKAGLAFKEWGELKIKYGETAITSDDDKIKLATILAVKKLEATQQHTFLLDGNTYYKDFVVTDANDYYVLNEKNLTAYKQYMANDLSSKEQLVKTAEDDLALAIAALGTEADKKDTKYVSGIDVNLADVMSLTKYAELAAAKEDLTAKEKTYKEKKEAYDKAKATKAEKANALTKAQDDLAANTDATKVQTLTDAVTAAQTAYNTADTAFGTAEAAYLPTVQPYEDAAKAVRIAEVAIADAKDEIIRKEVALATAKANLDLYENFEAYIATFEGEDYETYKTAVDAIETAWDEYMKLNNECNAVLDVLEGFEAFGNTQDIYVNIQEQIAQQEANIEDYKKQLATLTSQYQMNLPNGSNDTYNNTTNGYYTEADIEGLIAVIKEQIEVLKVKLSYEQKKAEQAKTALDAYLAESGDVESGEAEEA